MASLSTKFHQELLQTNRQTNGTESIFTSQRQQKETHKTCQLLLPHTSCNLVFTLKRRYRWYFPVPVSRLVQDLRRRAAVQFSQGDHAEARLCMSAWQETKPLRKKGRCNLYVYKCQKVKACNPFRRWWGLWLELGATPDFNARKVLTPTSGGERWVVISLSSPLALLCIHSPPLSPTLTGLFWYQYVWIYSSGVQYILSGMFHFM